MSPQINRILTWVSTFLMGMAFVGGVAAFLMLDHTIRHHINPNDVWKGRELQRLEYVERSSKLVMTQDLSQADTVRFIFLNGDTLTIAGGKILTKENEE